jgi:DNA polymerase
MPGMKNCVIDWESFWSDNISVVGQGVPNYTAASDGYIVSVCVDGKGYCGTRAEMGPMLEQLAADPTVRPVACNANFDAAWHNKYFTPFKQEWFCLLDLAAFHQMPRNLAMLAGVVLGHKVEKATRDEMKGVRYETLSAEEQGKVQQYCLNDSVKEMEILERLPPMSPLEEKVAAHTRLINRRGVQINVDLVEEDKTRLETMRFHAFKKIPWHADAPPLSYPQLVKCCGSRNISVPASLAKTDENCSDMMALNPELAELVGFMRRYRRSNTMLKKIESLTDRVTPEGVLPLDFLYCGAPHTRRWSCKGVNLQNLDKEPLVTLAATATEPAQTVWTRAWVIPRPGKIFYTADFAQVEPRVLNWLAGNEAMLAAMRAGYSIYESFSIQAEGWKGQPGSIKTELGKKNYTLLKNRVLGLGFGMGARKFEDYVRANGGDVSSSEAKAIVTNFRAGNQKIVRFWNKLDNLIVTACRDKSHDLGLVMPSGDLLKYFSIKSKMGGYEGYTTKGDFGHQSRQPRLWGGTLAENVTQRVARDVLAEAVIKLEEAGLPVAFTVHDEVILEIDDDGSKEEAAREAVRILTTPPAWCPDLPLAVEGNFADSYTKG